MGIGNRIGALKAALLVAAGAAGGGAALAVASVPDSDGVYHACVQVTTSGTATVPNTTTANLTMIDPGAGQQCVAPNPLRQTPGQTEVSWNATGPQGPPGTPGANGASGATGSPGAPGKSVTVAGGTTIASPAINPRGRGLGQATLAGSGIPAFTVLGVSAAPSTGKSGAGAGKTSLHDIVITKRVDTASPKLFQACANGKHFSTGTIILRKAGGKSEPYVKYILKDVIVSSYQTAPAGKSDVPEEHVSLNFTKIEIKY